MQKGSVYNDEDMKTYVLHTHGMESVLANIGNMELSTVAQRLETSGRNGSAEVIMAETPAFLVELRKIVDAFTENEEAPDDRMINEDLLFLRESLLTIKAACGSYDKKNVRIAIVELKEKTWSKPTVELLDAISEHLLHSDFAEVVNAVDAFLAAVDDPEIYT